MGVVRGVDLDVIDELLQSLLKNLALFTAAFVTLHAVFIPLSILPFNLGWFFTFSIESVVFLLPIYFLIRLYKRMKGVPIWKRIHSDEEIAVRRKGGLSYLSKGTFYSVMYGHLILLAGVVWLGLHDAIVNQEGLVANLKIILTEEGYDEAVNFVSMFGIGTADISTHTVHLVGTIVLALCLITVTVALFEKIGKTAMYGPNRLQRVLTFFHLEFLVLRKVLLHKKFPAIALLGLFDYLLLRYYVMLVAFVLRF